MKTKFNEVIQQWSAFICNYSIFAYQSIVFIVNDKSVHSFIILVICFILSFSVQKVLISFYSLNRVKGADDVIYQQFDNFILKRSKLTSILSLNLINTLVSETVSMQATSSANEKNFQKIEKIKNDFIDNLIVVLVDPPVGKVVTPTAFTDLHGQGYIFLKNFSNIDDMPVLPRFRILHEISHALFISFSLIAEQQFAPLIYRLLIIWIPWQLKWTWQSGIGFVILFLLAMDTWGTTYWSNVKRTLLQSEINADIIAAKLLSDDDKELLFDNLSDNNTGHAIPLFDKNFSDDENYIRFRRLLNFLNLKDVNLDLIGNIAPVSSWDFTWRALLVILLATESHSANWVVFTLGVVLVILLFVAWGSFSLWHQKYRFSIERKIGRLTPSI